MSDYSVEHTKFVISRKLKANPEKVFKAFSDPEAKVQWFLGPEESENSNHELDFRVGGREHVSGPFHGAVHAFDAIYQDIVTNVRIIYTYEMHLDDKRISVSLATLEFKPGSIGTELILTEQGAFLDGYDTVEQRESGTNGLIDSLQAYLAN